MLMFVWSSFKVHTGFWILWFEFPWKCMSSLRPGVLARLPQINRTLWALWHHLHRKEAGSLLVEAHGVFLKFTWWRYSFWYTCWLFGSARGVTLRRADLWCQGQYRCASCTRYLSCQWYGLSTGIASRASCCSQGLHKEYMCHDWSLLRRWLTCACPLQLLIYLLTSWIC